MATAPKKPAPAPTDLGKPTPEEEARMRAQVEDAKAQEKMSEAYNAAAPRSMGTYKEPVKKAKGGTASSRADGCAQRGKTRGKFV
jgi:hypothetical protein